MASEPEAIVGWQLVRAARILTWAFATALLVGAAGLLSRSYLGSDFIFFWNAGDRVLGGTAGLVYDLSGPASGGLYPMAYPPPFLLLVAPFGALPLEAALMAWLASTGLLYLLAARVPLRIALANPAVAINAIYGQTGYLTSALILAGGHRIGERPLLAGALLGAMVIKPQLALPIAVALVGGRHWASLGASAVTAAALLLLAALAFGPAIYAQWLSAWQHYAAGLWEGTWSWSVLASPYAFGRRFGMGHEPALAAHLVIAAGAVSLLWLAWRNDRPGKIAVLASAALLGSPYLFAYDAVLLAAPLGFLASAGRPRWALAVGIVMLAQFFLASPARQLILPQFEMLPPNLTPIAALLALIGSWLGKAPGASAR